jgi:hypothetical protein
MHAGRVELPRLPRTIDRFSRLRTPFLTHS